MIGAAEVRRKGFTLVELLVVIGIIAVLVGILIPALSKSRKQANRTACLSNLRQVYFCFEYYSDSFGGQIPIGFDGQDAEQSNFYVRNSTNPAGSPFTTLFGLFIGANLMNSPQIFYCPSEALPQYQFNTPENPWPPVQGQDTYVAFACRPVAYWAQSAVPTPMPRLLNLKSLALAADIISNSALVAERHSSGVNVVYGDGSAHYVPKAAFSVDLGKAGSGAFSSTHNANILDTTVTPNLGVWGDLDRN